MGATKHRADAHPVEAPARGARPRVLAAVFLLAACGPGTVEAPPLVMPTKVPTEEAGGFQVDPAAPYARLFEESARWTLPTKVWTGGGGPPEIVCTITSAHSFPAARAATLSCLSNRDVGPLASALPAYGVVATDDGLWITSNAGQIAPAPATDDELTTLLATQPMRLAAKPAPLHDTRKVDYPGDQGLQVEATVDAAARGDAWCLTDENTAGTETITSVLCLRAKEGLVGGLAVYRSQGIVLAALAWGDAPAPPDSTPFQVELPAQAEQVTLVSPGKGKKAVLALAPKAGVEQRVDYVIEGRTRSEVVGGKDPRKPVDAPHPTLTLRGTARVEAVETDGSFRYRFTVAETVASGAGVTPELAGSLKAIDGLVYEAVIGPDGRASRRMIRVEHPTPATPALVSQISQSMATFTVLPSQPIGVGATWTSRSPGRILDHDVEVTVHSRLAERKGARAVVISEASIVPFDQPVPRGTARVEARGGATMQTVAGSLIPMRSYDFTLSVVVHSPDPAAPREKVELLVRTRVLPK